MPSLEDRSGLQRKVAAKPSEGDRGTGNLVRRRRQMGANLTNITAACLRQRAEIVRTAFSPRHSVPAPLKTVPVFGWGLIEKTSIFLKLTALP